MADMFQCDLCHKIFPNKQKTVLEADVTDGPSKYNHKTYTRFFQLCPECAGKRKSGSKEKLVVKKTKTIK